MFEQAYVDGVMAIHLRGEVDVIATYREVYADSYSVDEAGSDEELIRACAVLDYEDGATGGACFQALWDSLQQQPEPKPETLWQHHNGGVYRVLHIANQQTTNPDKYPVTVVYQGVVNGAVWTRPLSDWHRSMTSVQGMKVFPVLLFSDGFWCYPCDLDTHKASLQEEGIDPNDYQTILVKLPLGAASNHGGEEEAIGCYIREHHLKPVFSMSL